MLVNHINNIFNIKLYNFFFNSFPSKSPLVWVSSGYHVFFFKNLDIFFFKKKLIWNYLNSFFKSFINNFSFFVSVFKFKWFRFVLFSGLGYKRRFFRKSKVILTYIADRHWILYKFDEFSTVIPTKKRNFIFFSSSKGWFTQDYGFFSNLRVPYIYKMKGFLDKRVKRRFLFARRIRLRKIKIKLSKKQKML